MTSGNIFTDFTIEGVYELVARLGAPRYRAEQLLRWVYQGFASSYDEMANLPVGFRRGVADAVPLHGINCVDEATGSDGTVKALFSLFDNKTVEGALMPYPPNMGRGRNTLCVSTQVGCPIRCPFCATGQQGFERDLTAGEIIDQVLYFARRLKEIQKGQGLGITNLVFMGMGEPLANYEALWQAVEVLNSPRGFGLGARSMTISTSGLVPGIVRLSRESLQVGLAVSLHAAENSLRDKLVPVNKRYPLEVLLPTCRAYFERTGRRVSFEYILFEGVNDSPHHALQLAQRLAGLGCHVNLIPANPTSSGKFRAPPARVILDFERELRGRGINCTVRQGRGLDIGGGCGQLRSRSERVRKEGSAG